MILPQALKSGSTIGVVSLASPPFRPSAVAEGVANLEKMGYQVKLAPHLMDVNRYLSGKDEDRLTDFHAMVQDPSIAAIMSTRGGYGSGRILTRLDFDLIKRNPKIYIGYSDITSILVAITEKTGIVTFYGPMLSSDFKDPVSGYTVDFFKRLIANGESSIPIQAYPDPQKALVIAAGKAEGALTGGCLTLLTYLMGTPYEFDTRGKILFIEEIDEAPYRLDGMLTHLYNAGKLQQCAGIAIGELVDCDPKSGYPMGSFHWEDVLADRLGNLGIPVLANLCFGHGPHKATLPLGVRARIDTVSREMTLLEASVQV